MLSMIVMVSCEKQSLYPLCIWLAPKARYAEICLSLRFPGCEVKVKVVYEVHLNYLGVEASVMMYLSLSSTV